MQRAVWIVSEVFGQQEDSTGILLAQLAEGLRAEHEVKVATSLMLRQRRFRWPQRVAVLARAIHGAMEAVRLGWTVGRNARAGDVVIALTNPPLLPAALTVFAAWRRFNLVVLVHDVYPEALDASRPARRRSSRAFDRLNVWALRRARRVVVIGRDMQRLLSAKLGPEATHIECIPNWADLSPTDLTHVPAGRTGGGMVVQYSGKMGFTHNPWLIARTAAILQERRSGIRIDIHGWGTHVQTLRDLVREHGLLNVSLLEPCARSELEQQLGRCDAGLIVMRRRMTGVSVPCRLYNLMAAGRPIIAAVDPDSEVGLVVRETGVGWIADPDDPVSLADAICAAAQHRVELPEMGMRARKAAREQYSFARALGQYRRVIAECPGAAGKASANRLGTER